MDFPAIDQRVAYLEDQQRRSVAFKRRSALESEFEQFLAASPGKPSLSSCGPHDVRNYLIWKDSFGKTKVHSVSCPFLGGKDQSPCCCPLRLAIGTVNNYIQKLGVIFHEAGRGDTWCEKSFSGNPAKSPIIKTYGKQVALEQAKAQILPKQAKPMMLDKLRRMSSYIRNESSRGDLKMQQVFVLMRDQAFFKLQYFAGDRASDITSIPTQAVKRLPDNSGFKFCLTVTKSIRGGKGRSNTFVVKRCSDELICPIKGLESYFHWCESRSVCLSNGYLFRIVSGSGRVLDQSVSYSVVYDRLIEYLTTLGIYAGETPHSFRAGCAVVMGLSGSVSSEKDMMNHLGWFTPDSAYYYSRVKQLKDASEVAQRFADSVGDFDNVHGSMNDLLSDYGNAF